MGSNGILRENAISTAVEKESGNHSGEKEKPSLHRMLYNVHFHLDPVHLDNIRFVKTNEGLILIMKVHLEESH